MEIRLAGELAIVTTSCPTHIPLLLTMGRQEFSNWRVGVSLPTFATRRPAVRSRLLGGSLFCLCTRLSQAGAISGERL